jgi:hypothetical protein
MGTWTGAGDGLGTCARAVAVEERSTTEKQAAKQVIRVPILPDNMISLGLQREVMRKPEERGFGDSMLGCVLSSGFGADLVDAV